MALHHPVYQVNQAIGGIGHGELGAFGSLFHRWNFRFSIPCLVPRLRRHLEFLDVKFPDSVGDGRHLT